MRKSPRQERSRQMVENLIDATERCIARHGLDGTTTPRVAEIAGVSVGSLYQYFGDKEALVDAVVTRQAEWIGRGLRRLPLDENSTLEDITRITVEFGVALLSDEQGLYAELVRNWHRLPTQRVADQLQQFFMELTTAYLLKHHRVLQMPHLQVKLFVIVNSTLFTLVRLVGQNNPLITPRRVADELVAMITGYLSAAAVEAAAECVDQKV